MTSVLLQPGSTGVDGVALSTLRDWSRVPQAGFSWASVYLGGTYAVQPYAIEAAWDAGVPVMLNFERSPDAAKGGYRVGEAHAKLAIAQARQLGFNGECPLPFSAADEHFPDIAGAGLDYHRALVDVFTPIGWVGGAYGFKEMLALLAEQDWWPNNWPLWHWGGDGKTIYPWTWVKQGPGGSYFDETIHMQVDRNTLYKPMKFWSGYGDDPFDPTEDEVTPEQAAHIDAQFQAIWNVLTQPIEGTTDPSMQWCSVLTYDMLVKGQLADQVAAKVAAIIPAPGGGGLSKQDIIDAVNEAMRLISLTVDFQTG